MQINSRPGSKFANIPCGWSTFGLVESSCGKCNKELSLLCLVKIEIGLACAPAGLILDCCLLEQHYRLLFNFLLHETPLVLCSLLDCAPLKCFCLHHRGIVWLKISQCQRFLNEEETLHFTDRLMNQGLS